MNVFEENHYLWGPSSRQSNNLKVVRLELSDEKHKKLSAQHSNLQVSTKVPVRKHVQQVYNYFSQERVHFMFQSLDLSLSLNTFFGLARHLGYRSIGKIWRTKRDFTTVIILS